MLIGRKCEFKIGNSNVTGIIVEKYLRSSRDSTAFDCYVVDTSNVVLEHITCTCLTKILN